MIRHLTVSEWVIWALFLGLSAVFLALGTSRIGRRMA